MASLYESASATATKLLTKHGESVTFTRETTTSFDPATGEETVTASTFSGYANPSPYALHEIDGTLVQRGDIRLMTESLSIMPVPGDAVTFRSESYRVMHVQPISVNGGDAAYYVQARK